MKNKNILFYFACITILASCNGSSEEKAKMDLTSPAKLDVSDVNPGGFESAEAVNGAVDERVAVREATPADKIPEKIRKTADIDITVKDYSEGRRKIGELVKSVNGYIGSERESNSAYRISNDMVIRVRNKDFDAVLANVSGIASHVNSKNITAEDVTAQYVDITARLKTKKEVEQRYIEILSKATKVSEIMEVEQQIRVLREEIEAKEGELKYLNDQVDYSTINLSVHQDFEYTPVDEPGFFGRICNAFGKGWKGFLTFVIGVVYAWPLWLILGLVVYFLLRFLRKRKK